MFLKIPFKILRLATAYVRIRVKNIILKLKLVFGKNVFIGSNVVIDPGYHWLISIGNNSAITNGVTILSHDGSLSRHTGYTKIGKVSIGSNTFIGVKSIILPGVSIGNNVIIGAGSVVTKDIPDNSVAIGNPAVVVGSIKDYINKHKRMIRTSEVYECQSLLKDNIRDFKGEIGYVKTNFENHEDL
ncbi:Maltose O-acetyltransferase [Methanosarcina barkeri str. Wiesmoor]|uniref:Maltose O-acetyltransferase n=2 Tax=Methanosarcina barkeri TaxID=2208 RepID=A0A0E3QKW0_METBA|nr:acyltransferase [Methanosarcina barkeri]AKB50204.1 Maltose O-acetyltransferase [Methanosarcina barkeri str. Wiesmoor]